MLESRQGALEIPKQRLGAGSVQTDLLTAVYQLLLLFDDLVGFRNMLLPYFKPCLGHANIISN